MDVSYKGRKQIPKKEEVHEDVELNLFLCKASDLPSSSKNLLYNSYLESVRHDDKNIVLHKEIYFKIQKPIIERIIIDSYVILASDIEDPNRHYGYLLYEHKLIQDASTGEDNVITCIHFVYVKYIFRKLGIGTKLFEEYKRLNKQDNDSILCSYTNWNFTKYSKKFNLLANPLLLY